MKTLKWGKQKPWEMIKLIKVALDLFNDVLSNVDITYCHVCVTIDGVWICDSIIDHFNTQHVITNNSSAIAHLHTLHITRTHSKSSQSVFISRFLITDFNN
jgi:hypothetical protein